MDIFGEMPLTIARSPEWWIWPYLVFAWEVVIIELSATCFDLEPPVSIVAECAR
jgi:hypothetical protein